MSKSPFFDQNYGHIYFLDTLQGQIVVSSHRPICLDAKSPKLLNLVKEIFLRRTIVVINVKITSLGPELWSYLFFGHPVGSNSGQQSYAYLCVQMQIQKSQIAQPRKGNIFRGPIIVLWHSENSLQVPPLVSSFQPPTTHSNSQ